MLSLKTIIWFATPRSYHFDLIFCRLYLHGFHHVKWVNTISPSKLSFYFLLVTWSSFSFKFRAKHLPILPCLKLNNIRFGSIDCQATSLKPNNKSVPIPNCLQAQRFVQNYFVLDLTIEVVSSAYKTKGDWIILLGRITFLSGGRKIMKINVASCQHD